VTGPLQQVLEQITVGAPTVAEITRRTGLRPAIVHAAIDHLVRTGRIDSTELSLGCPTGGCGGCPAAGNGCSIPPTGQRGRRPGLVSITLRTRLS
jgi:hypothetical protein